MKTITLVVLAVLIAVLLAAYYYQTPEETPEIEGLFIQADISSGTAPLTVTFTPIGDYLTKNTITNYNWNFGGSPIIDSASPTPRKRTYSTPGNHTVTLTVTTSAGETKVLTKTIEVLAENSS
jgi:PKD repeat protein